MAKKRIAGYDPQLTGEPIVRLIDQEARAREITVNALNHALRELDPNSPDLSSIRYRAKRDNSCRLNTADQVCVWLGHHIGDVYGAEYWNTPIELKAK